MSKVSAQSAPSETTKIDIYTSITNRIVAMLEKGEMPWHCPWKKKTGNISRPLRSNGIPYSGVNVLQLWLSAMDQGFSNPYWMTFNQIKELGGCVKKGSKGTQVVYASTFEKNGEDSEGNEITQKIPFLKTYVVFNVEQTEDLPEKYVKKYGLDDSDEPSVNKDEMIAECEAFFKKVGSDLKHGGNQAYYSPALDYVQMPTFKMFESAEAYYATLSHEHIHWTRHKSRLDRDYNQKRFGDEGYAMEELVAELGSAFLCADLGLNTMADDKHQHAAYIQSWIKVLKDDKRAIFTAASAASKAVDYLHSLQSK